MRKFTFKRMAVIGSMAALLAFLAGCFNPEVTTPSSDSGDAAVIGVRVGLPQEVTLKKGAVISLKKLVLVLTSNANDTIRDTITQSTIPALSASVAASQTVGKYYGLKPLRSWKLVAKTIDVKDSVIHLDSVSVSTPILSGDTAVIALSMNAKFVMYQANFLLPDSIGSSDTAVKVKQKINFNRLVLQIDGVNVVDSTRTYFAFRPNVSSLYYDYVRVGDHVVKLLAYGNLGGGGSQLLYRDSTNINPATDTTLVRSLAYVGPNGNTATGNALVSIGKVNTVTINGTPEPNPLP